MGSSDIAAWVVAMVVGALAALAGVVLMRGRRRQETPAEPALAPLPEAGVADGAQAALAAARAELERRQARAERNERMHNLLLARTSHDLRTPLNSIITLSQLLVEGDTGPLGNERRQYLEVIHRSGESLLTLMNGILDLASVDAGRLEVDLASVDVRGALHDAAEAAGRHARAKGLAFRASLPRRGLFARTDEDRLRQIVGSLLDASIAATTNGYVELSAEGQGDEVRIRITDTGPGLSAEARDLTSDTSFLRFVEDADPFSRRRRVAGARAALRTAGADGSSGEGSEERGAAPGLAHILAGKLVALMGGTLSADGAPGEGTTLAIVLPRSHPDAAESAAATSGDEILRGRVLLIEDNDLERRRLAESIQGMGLEVTATATGDEGLGRLRAAGAEATAFDVVVLDLVMPGTTGLDVLRAAAADERMSRVPFLVVSAMYMTKTERDVLGPHVAAVVRKGESMFEELRSGLRRVLRNQKRSSNAAASSGGRGNGGEGSGRGGYELAPAEPHRRKARVLIVDDNADNLFSLEQVLAPLPVVIETASTGAAAIESCRRQAPDLIVMDVEMPGPSGLETARVIRTLPDCRDVPVIALTAEAMRGDRERALADCNSYLSKPVEPKQVVSAVTRALHIQLH